LRLGKLAVKITLSFHRKISAGWPKNHGKVNPIVTKMSTRKEISTKIPGILLLDHLYDPLLYRYLVTTSNKTKKNCKDFAFPRDQCGNRFSLDFPNSSSFCNVVLKSYFSS
jgi:hypothetical protein